MTDRITLSILATDDAVAFQQVLAIYSEAIEPTEQKPLDEIVRLLADPRYAMIVSRDVLGVSGFAMLFFPTRHAFWLLEYMAVRRDRRSHGIGKRLFFAARDVAARRCPDAPGVLEVDQPSATVTSGNDPLRRLRFYRDLGCRQIEGLDYALPLEGPRLAPPMRLLVSGLEGQSVIAKVTLREWLTVIYTQVYHRPSDDVRIAMMLAPLQEHCALSAP